MKNKIMKLAAIIFVTGAVPSYAVPVAYNLNVSATESNLDFGTGVTVGEIFQGRVFIDSDDLLTDGHVFGTPAIDDVLTIAGINFANLLHIITTDLGGTSLGAFAVSGGVPQCITVTGSCDGNNLSAAGDIFNRVLGFRSNLIGYVSSNDERFEFSYSFSSTAVTEPGAFALLAFGLCGLACRRS